MMHSRGTMKTRMLPLNHKELFAKCKHGANHSQKREKKVEKGEKIKGKERFLNFLTVCWWWSKEDDFSSTYRIQFLRNYWNKMAEIYQCDEVYASISNKKKIIWNGQPCREKCTKTEWKVEMSLYAHWNFTFTALQIVSIDPKSFFTHPSCPQVHHKELNWNWLWK